MKTILTAFMICIFSTLSFAQGRFRKQMEIDAKQIDLAFKIDSVNHKVDSLESLLRSEKITLKEAIYSIEQQVTIHKANAFDAKRQFDEEEKIIDQLLSRENGILRMVNGQEQFEKK